MERFLKNKKKKNPYIWAHILIGLIACLIMVVIIQWDKGIFKTEFYEGDIALRAIYSPYNFSLQGEIDTAMTEVAKKKAMHAVLPVYTLDTDIQKTVLKKAEGIVALAKHLKETPDIDSENKAKIITESAAAYNLSESLIEPVLMLKDYDGFFEQVMSIVENYMSKGIISTPDMVQLEGRNIKNIKLLNKAVGNEEVIYIKAVSTLDGLRKEVENVAAIIKDKKLRQVVSDFVNAILTVNVIYNRGKTETEQNLAVSQIQPIYKIIEVKKNETIVNKGERINKMHLIKLKGIEQNELSVMRIGGVFAIIILVGLFMILVALYISFYESKLLLGNKELILLALICSILLLTAKVIVISPWPTTLVPVAVASMLIAMLINSHLAIITTCFLSILVGIISGNILDMAGVSLVGGMVGIFAIRGVRRRSQLITAGVCVGFANMSYLIGMGLIRALDFNIYIIESLFGLANGIMSAVIITGVLPIFENIFKITTDISLLELADLNHPLLKELVIKAPGTYHHSLVVGNLAEAACEAIGANSLLARVGSYFHDIGKIEKASYFSENETMGGVSAHNKLSPTMSSLIITNHVKNGIDLAQKYKLNKKIIDIIKQHHGTGLVFYFFKRALEKVPDDEVGEQSFRYPGPKPQTKEAACVLLADSVEAASRSLDDPTHSRIKGLVRKIINNKFINGQLDECDLTLKDLEKIAEIFCHILTGIFHTRVEYPEDNNA